MHNEKKKLEAKNIIKKIKFAGGITTEQIMNMSKTQQEQFVTLNTPTWTQSTLRELNFSMTITEKKINSRTQSEVQHHSITVKKQTQLRIQNNWILAPSNENSEEDTKLVVNKKRKKERKGNTHNTQLR